MLNVTGSGRVERNGALGNSIVEGAVVKAGRSRKCSGYGEVEVRRIDYRNSSFLGKLVSDYCDAEGAVLIRQGTHLTFLPDPEDAEVWVAHLSKAPILGLKITVQTHRPKNGEINLAMESL